jgi:hypothetical protein
MHNIRFPCLPGEVQTELLGTDMLGRQKQKRSHSHNNSICTLEIVTVGWVEYPSNKTSMVFTLKKEAILFPSSRKKINCTILFKRAFSFSRRWILTLLPSGFWHRVVMWYIFVQTETKVAHKPLHIVIPFKKISRNYCTTYALWRPLFSVLLPGWKVAADVKAMLKYCVRASWCDSNPHSLYIFNYIGEFSWTM